MRRNDPKYTVKVAAVPRSEGVTVGKPRRIVTSAMRAKVAFPMSGGSMMGQGGNFYSPELSPDFLELPQSVDEQRNYYRFFYDHDPFVGQAIDLHSELPLSKLRLRKPRAKNKKLSEASMRFCERWVKKIGLLHRLLEIVHDFYLIGEVFVSAEDTSEEMPKAVTHEPRKEVTPEGKIVDDWVEREDARERQVEWLKKNYKGWTGLRVLPPEQIHMESFPFTDKRLIELILDSKTKALVERARQGDVRALEIVDSYPADIIEHVLSGTNIPLNTNPMAGSFVHYMARKKSSYEPRGKSILQRCLLPGTPIWVRRSGVVQQVLVEDVIEGDEALTHRGRFRRFTGIGSREVNEEVVTLEIEGIPTPLSMTSDHEVLCIGADGSEHWVESRNLEEGDLLREAHVASGESAVKVIDLESWWRGRALSVQLAHKGRAPKERELLALKVSRTADGLTVLFECPGDNLGATKAIPKMGLLLQWLQELDSPTEAPYSVVSEETGLSPREIRNYAHKFRTDLGLQTESRSLGRGKGRVTTWWPLPDSVTVPGSTCAVTRVSPVTQIVVDEAFCYLLGTWLGDGCVWTQGEGLNAHSIAWSLHESSPEVISKVTEAVSVVFPASDVLRGGLIGGASGTGKDNLRIEDSLLARWFVEEFGKGAGGKRLPGWVFELPPESLLWILRGVSDTDGHVRTGGRQSSIEITLKNPLLISQLHLLCNRVGLHTGTGVCVKKPSTWTRSWETQEGEKTKTYHYGERSYSKLICSRAVDVQRWLEGSAKDPRVDFSQYKKTWKSKFEQGWLTRRITGIKCNTYEGLVHSFDVSEDHSHVTGGVVTHNCLRVLVYRDKLRQAQTSIASRHMTPIRVVWAEDMNAEQTEELREQVDLALQDPDFSIIANFQVNWEEMGGGQGNRLLELTSEYDLTDRQLYAGLGVTESLLSGEASYSGDRIHLEVINVRYLLLREVLQDFVDYQLLEPMCRRMGFVEKDEDGHEVVIHPRLSFTRLALRDNQETFDALFNLYTKGSLDIDTILDLLNIDADTVHEKLERDFGTFRDATFNELSRSLFSRAGDQIVENSDFVEQMAERIGATYNKPKEDDDGMSRFASVGKGVGTPVDLLKAAVKAAMQEHFANEVPISGSRGDDMQDRLSSLEAELTSLREQLRK